MLKSETKKSGFIPIFLAQRPVFLGLITLVNSIRLRMLYLKNVFISVNNLYYFLCLLL